MMIVGVCKIFSFLWLIKYGYFQEADTSVMDCILLLTDYREM